MFFDYATFILWFPEFATKDDLVVKSLIAQVEMEVNYAQICDRDKRVYAKCLYVAHLLMLMPSNLSGEDGRDIERLESRNEKVTYSKRESAGDDGLGSTRYGVRLRTLLDSYYRGGFLV